jgi:hypothetical protein
MSTTREDTIFEIFTFIQSNEKTQSIWNDKLFRIQNKKKYIEPYEAWCLAYEEVKLELEKIKNENNK